MCVHQRFLRITNSFLYLATIGACMQYMYRCVFTYRTERRNNQFGLNLVESNYKWKRGILCHFLLNILRPISQLCKWLANLINYTFFYLFYKTTFQREDCNFSKLSFNYLKWSVLTFIKELFSISILNLIIAISVVFVTSYIFSFSSFNFIRHWDALFSFH